MGNATPSCTCNWTRWLRWWTKTHRGTPFLYQQVPGTHWSIHMHIPVSARRFLLATQNRGWHTQRVFNLPQTTASIKTRKATTALCQSVGWGWWAELGGPCVEQGCCWWMDEGRTQAAQWKAQLRFLWIKEDICTCWVTMECTHKKWGQ